MIGVYFAILFAGFMIMFPSAGSAENKIIGVSWSNLQEERWKTDEAAMRAAIDANGDRYIGADAQASATKQLADIEDLIASGADVLIILAVDTAALGPAIEKATANGIPVISYSRLIESPGAFYVAFDQKEVGRMQAREILSAMPEGNYAFIRGDRSDPNANFLFEGQMEVLRKAIDSGKIKNVGEAYTDGWRPENAQRNMEQILTANDNNVDAVVAGNDSTAAGVIAALNKHGLAGSVPVSGQDGDHAALNRVARGTQTVSVWMDARELGKAAGNIAAMLADGKAMSDIPNATKWSGGTKGVEMNAMLLAPVPITRENLNVVTDAGWIDIDTVCSDAHESTAAFCRSATLNLPVVDVCFASDRKQDRTARRPTFSHDRDSNFALGFARVSIPEDNHEFGKRERPEKKRFIWIISYGGEEEDSNEHFVIQKMEILEEGQFLEKSKAVLSRSRFYQDHILLFIHGFNVGFDDAVYAAAQISWDINFDGLPCIYSWPSRGELSLAAYTYDRNSAQQSRNRIASFLKMLAGIKGAKHVSIVAHSMGNMALIEALRQLQTPGESSKKLFSEIVLAAPDMDRDNFIDLAGMLPKFADGVTLYASANDKALNASKRLAAKIPRAGDVPDGGPVVVPMIDTIDASSVSSYVFGMNHSYFATNRSVVSDIGRLILRSERPPITRNATFKLMTKPDGRSYWRFPN